MRVLFVSGYPDEAEISSEHTAEKTDFLQKPFTSDTFLRRVRQNLDGTEQAVATGPTSSH
jgi:hypothetical protein